MNDFEQELKKQPIRSVPGHWRAHILKAAADARDTLKREHQPWWAALLWPSPKAWGTLAAAWALMGCFSLGTRDSGSTQQKSRTAEMRLAIEEKRRLQKEIEQVSLSLDAKPGPRSEALHGRSTG